MVLTLGHWKTSRSSAVVNRRFVGHAIAPTRKHAYRATAISGLFGMWRTARSPWRTPRATKARDSSSAPVSRFRLIHRTSSKMKAVLLGRVLARWKQGVHGSHCIFFAFSFPIERSLRPPRGGRHGGAQG